MSEWNKFITFLSTENININELQIYVDSIGMQSNQVNHLMQSQQSMPSITKK